nr:hypothetical protein [Comamonas jiangduensis]
MPCDCASARGQLQKWVYVGVSTDTGFRFSVDHTHNRVPYLDWRAQSKLQLDKKNPLLSTRITSLPDYSGWNYFVGGKAAVKNWRTTPPTV